MPSVILVDVWQWTPFMFLVILAGLNSLPQEVLEAGDVDGASGKQRLWYITLPLLRPVSASPCYFDSWTPSRRSTSFTP